MLCVPCVSVPVETDAAPAARVPVPICVEPSKKFTVPVIVPAVCDVTVAVKVMDCPTVEGLSEEAMAVVVAGFVLALTTCETAGEVLAAKLLSPPYCAVMLCVPCVSVPIETEAVPPARVPAPICVDPSKKVTVPVMVPAA